MGRPVRSKKVAFSQPPGPTCVNWTYPAKNDPHRPMEDRILRLDRRELLAGLGASVAAPAMASTAGAPGSPYLKLPAKTSVIALRPGGPDTAILAPPGPAPGRSIRLHCGD